MFVPRCVVVMVLLTVFASAARSQAVADTIDLRPVFGDRDACFVLLDAATGHLSVYHPDKAAQRFTPASTFKIPHTLIILESGLGEYDTFAMTWDSVKVPPRQWWPEAWRGDQTLRSAFRNSVVWFYQETARRIGEHQMRSYLRAFAYGDQDMGGGIDRFWLSGGLRISPLEQVSFLRKVYAGEIRTTAATRAALLDAMLLEATDGVRLYGKTGTGTAESGSDLAWLVGFVEADNRTYVYALLLEGASVSQEWPPARRRELLKECLEALHIIG